MTRFTNWSGSVSCTPAVLAEPEDEAELVRLMREAYEGRKTVRPVGSGHSSTPLMTTDDVMISLDRLSGVIASDRENLRATVRPGTGLDALGAALEKEDLALENFGDVAYQAIAGAIGTGTHGTGRNIGTLSSMLIGGTLITAEGEKLRFGVDGDEDSQEVLRAARVSLGALGIFSELTLRLKPAYQLHRENWLTHIDWVFEHFDALTQDNRHFDFYWYPRSDLVQVRMVNMPGEEPGLRPPGRLLKEEVGPSYALLPHERELRYEEMEYMLPLEAGMKAFREARERIKARHRQIVGWRVLVRTVGADDAMLSTTAGRPTVSIALLQNARLPYEGYFEDMEPLLRSYAGRPHWGKKHSLQAEALRSLYPEWDAFQGVRRRLDPEGRLLNPYLRELFGETGGAG